MGIRKPARVAKLVCLLFFVNSVPSYSALLPCNSNETMRTSTKEKLAGSPLSSSKFKSEWIFYSKTLQDNSNQMKLELVVSTENKFASKLLLTTDLLNPNEKESVFNSFAYLTSDSYLAKKYITSLNSKCVHGGILPEFAEPEDVQNFHNWLGNSDKRQLLLIDADMSTLKNDIMSEFNNWKHTKGITTNDMGTLSSRESLTFESGEIPFFTTGRKFNITVITFSKDNHLRTLVRQVTLHAAQINTAIKLRVDLDGNPIEFAGLQGNSLYAMIQPKTKIVSFMRDELNGIARMTQDFWSSIGVTTEAVLNPNHAIFKIFETEVENKIVGQYEGKSFPYGVYLDTFYNMNKAKGCAIFISSDGNVKLIVPRKFIDTYPKWNMQEKQELAVTVKENSDKIDMIWTGDVYAMLNLVRLEEVKHHVESLNLIEALENIPNLAEFATCDVRANLLILQKQWQNFVVNVGPDVRLSPWQIVKGLSRNSKLAQSHFEYDHIPTSINPLFLNKIVVNGFANNDPFSLAILGIRLGHDSITNSTDWVGDGSYFINSKKWGKILQSLGKNVGINSLDSEIGVLVLSKMVQQANGINNKFEKSFAITNLLTDSKIIVKQVQNTEIATVMLPKVPVLISLDDALDLPKLQATANWVFRKEWSHFDLTIPTVSYENSRFFEDDLYDWFGIQTPNETEQRLGELMKCQHNLDFLSENPNVAGIVFPPNDEDIRGTNYRRDSVVDFGEQQRVHLERALPEKLATGVFKCKPNSEDNPNPALFQNDRRLAYLCQNAIALIQSNIKADQVMVYDLGDGEDYVLTGDELIPNLFLMGNEGDKTFYGGPVRDTFRFDSTCSRSLSGEFFGGNGDDRISLGNQCAKGQEIYASFIQNTLKSSGNNVNFQFGSIEEFSGRAGERDVVEVAQSTKWVSGKGGASHKKMDEITVQTDKFHRNAEFELTIIGSEYTLINSTVQRGEITIGVNNPFYGLFANLELHSNLQLNIIFMNTSSSDIVGYSMKTQNKLVELTLKADQQEMHFTFHKKSTRRFVDMPIYFSKDKSHQFLNSVMLLTEQSFTTNTSVFYHYIPNVNGKLERIGCQVMENLFDVHNSDSWIKGGELDDEYILHTDNIGMINGGNGIDTLKLHEDFTYAISMDLRSNQYKSLENVFGVPGVPLHVITACDTRMVAGQGGSKTEPDVITISDSLCNGNYLRVVATGHTHMETMPKNNNIDDSNKNGLIYLLVHPTDNTELNFDLVTKSLDTENFLVAIVISHKNWTVDEAKIDKSHGTILIRLSGEDQSGQRDEINLNLKYEVIGNDIFIKLPYIQLLVANSVDVPAVLMFDQNTEKVKLVHQLDDPSTLISDATGFVGIENIFISQTSAKKWNATGGMLNDQFFLTATTRDGGQYVIHGGSGGNDNILFVDSAGLRHKPFLINLISGELGYVSTQSGKRGHVENIQHIVGRVNAPDVVHVNCDTKTVDGRGGRKDGRLRDVIHIRYSSCNYKMLLNVGHFTSVHNNAVKGEFTYYVKELLTTSLELKPRRRSSHLIKFDFHPWKHITDVIFDGANEELRWRLSNGIRERVQIFKMLRLFGREEYHNPVFEFSPHGSHVRSDIRVSSNWTTMATFLVNGNSESLDVNGISVDWNKFIINITQKHNILEPKGSVQGCHHCSAYRANRFWILNLGSGLTNLDGGNCRQFGCTNYLYLNKEYLHEELYIDLDIANGWMRTGQGQLLITSLKNIHELHGTPKTTAYVTHDITQVTNVGQVIVKAEAKPLNMVIQVENYTKVYFQENHKPNYSILNSSTVIYRFSQPMSFDPTGSFQSLLLHKHIYHLPFSFDTLSELHFDRKKTKLFYTLEGVEYNHLMICGPAFFEQFYPQPSFVTEDGYRIQVARDGSVWVTLGDENGANFNASHIPYLQRNANKLGVTMLLKSADEILFIGHSTTSTAPDRNVLQNVANLTSHLAGGEANNTLYEIICLEKDVIIYTGFTEESFHDFLLSSSTTKQTIDLTDIIIPLRQHTGTKYVPQLRSEDRQLIIEMEPYLDLYPGKVIIVNGAYPWVANRMQLLLGSALMALEPIFKPQLSLNLYAKTNWQISPRPVIIPKEASVYILSPEDLEDGQEIILDPIASHQIHEEPRSNKADSSFKAARNGTHLYLTNIHTSDKLKTVVIADLFEHSPYIDFTNYKQHADFRNDLSPNQTKWTDLWYMRCARLPINLFNVTVDLPGLKLKLSQTDLVNFTNPRNTTGYQISLSNWAHTLHHLEHTLLKYMPWIPRTFPFQGGWWKQQRLRSANKQPCSSA